MYPEIPVLGNKEKKEQIPIQFPKQTQESQPGIEQAIHPLPIFDNTEQERGNKLQNKVALITGGDSGIGKAVAILFAKQGCDIALSYLEENEDANVTKKCIEDYGRRCLLLPGDLRQEETSKNIITKVINEYHKIDILVNNCAFQMPQNSLLDITTEQLLRTFETNFFSYFYLTRTALPYLKGGCSIINTSSITAFQGNERLIDYSATKGAISNFTRSLAKSLVAQKIRVNEVAPGPIWTPLIFSGMTEEEVETFGYNTPLKRAGQPFEVAPAYLYLACEEDSKYVTGQTIHVNGGTII
ncbi:MAG: SDR family oxidoreductase [Clostridia bacterium]|nr:SDR family oxidoreductase [Clostridia bacterium]